MVPLVVLFGLRFVLLLVIDCLRVGFVFSDLLLGCRGYLCCVWLLIYGGVWFCIWFAVYLLVWCCG